MPHMPRYAAFVPPRPSVFVGFRIGLLGIVCIAAAMGGATAATDLGISGEFGGLYRVDGPDIIRYGGRRVMFMGGDPVAEQIGLGAIYSSVQAADGVWRRPRVAFLRQGCTLPALEGAVSIAEPHKELSDADADAATETEKEGTLLEKPVCEIKNPEDHPLLPAKDGTVDLQEIPRITAKIEALTQKHAISSPSIVKHPQLDRYYMFYVMRTKHPVERNTIGAAIASPCAVSPDDSGLCWRDISASILPAQSGIAVGRGGISALWQDGNFALYYRTPAPDSRLVRSLLDARNRRVMETRPLTFQENHAITKNWRMLEPHQQIGIGNIDVKPYGKGYMMVGNDSSSHAIGRWKSEDGINFYRDPYDANAPIMFDLVRTFSDPYLEPGTPNEFTVYYVSSVPEGACASRRCPDSIMEHRFREEVNPKVFDNYYFSEDYVEPDYDSVKPAEDAYTRKKNNRTQR